MRVFIYRSSPSASALALASALREAGVSAKKISRPRRRILAGDVLVGWGDTYTSAEPPTVSLNWQPPTGKLTELRTLEAAGVQTVRFSATEPPTTDGETWLGRAFQHHSGNDLLTPPPRPGFWVLKESIRREFRIHVWRNEEGGQPLSSRVAAKVPKGEDAHPWVRSHSAGWRLDYGEGARTVKQRHRDAAKAAVLALGLDFAAVDIAETEDKRVLVLEVNRAPGLEGETIAKYRDKIIQRIGGPSAAGVPVGVHGAAGEGDPGRPAGGLPEVDAG